MRRMNRMIAIGVSASLLLGGCASAVGTNEQDRTQVETLATGAEETAVQSTLAKIDDTKWCYDETDDVYYQLGIAYCATPADADYEQLAIIVPGAYMQATANGDGTFTCSIDASAEVGGYTAATAPIVMPINTPGYMPQAPMTEYTSVAEYTDAGFIYVHAGCRGRDAGAPAGVTDLKAAIRYLRYTAGNLAGDTERIFSFGMSGGGAQSALLGVTGDSSLYDDYLAAIGAVEGVSDAVLGSQAWCPVTSLDSADEAYEWMMGNTRTDLSEEEQTISEELTTAYAAYINQLGLTDENGAPLTLEASADGRYQAGSYYDYMKEIIEESLNDFLADTSFPYDADAASGHDGMGPGGMGQGDPHGGHGPRGNAGGQGQMAPGNGMAGAADGKTPSGGTAEDNAGGQGQMAPQDDTVGAAEGRTSPGGSAENNAGGRGERTPGNDTVGAADGKTSSGVSAEGNANGQGQMASGNDTVGAADGKTSSGGSAVGNAFGLGQMASGNGMAPGGDEAEAGCIGAQTDFTAIDQIQRKENSSGVKISGTFETVQDYIDALNADGTWVNYDAATGTATITSIADFAAAVKVASKGIAAFDQLDASQGENTLFGYGDGAGAHFDATLAGILENIGSGYAADYSDDMTRVDALGHNVADRVKMYSPLYYLLASSEGYQSANVAKYFRINSGLWQGDTAVNTEANLALALKNYGASVDYSFVWGQKHTTAERSGDATSNFIDWVNHCLAD